MSNPLTTLTRQVILFNRLDQRSSKCKDHEKHEQLKSMRFRQSKYVQMMSKDLGLKIQWCNGRVRTLVNSDGIRVWCSSFSDEMNEYCQRFI